MKKTRLAALGLALLTLLGLTACNSGLSTLDAARCVEVELDATYKGQFDGFVDFYNNVTREDARSQYDNNIEAESYNTIMAFGLTTIDGEGTVEPSELQLHRARQLYEDIYLRSDYSVVSSTKQSDGTFAVKLSIHPMDILHLLSDSFDDAFADFIAKYENVDTISMTDEEFETWYLEAYVSDYYDTFLDALEAQIPNIGYLDEKTIVIQVLENENGLYFTQEDWANLDALIIDYNF